MNSEESKKNEPLLKDAWQRFADYDLNSENQQKSFTRLQFWILFFGGAASFLALLHAQLFGISSPSSRTVPELILRGAVILTPVTISILMTASNIFKPGSKWIPLRRAAEEIKSEIYSYRTLSHLKFLDVTQIPAITWEQKLRKKIDRVSGWLMETDVSKTALKKYEGSLPPDMDEASQSDDGFSPLTAGQYLDIRLGDQLRFYQNRTMKFTRKMKKCQWAVVIFGGIGTFLAAIGVELWVPLTTTLVGIFTSYLEYRQLENNLMIYNQAKHSLLEIKGWWSDLTDDMRKNAGNIKDLVETTEKILQSELSRWVQNMESALQELRAKQAAKEGIK